MLKFLIALLAAPSAFLVFREAVRAFLKVALSDGTAFWFTGGFLSYAAVHVYIFRAQRVYVVAHELTHALAALLSGYRVTGIDVGGRSGSVSTVGTNAFVSLAPYCIPFYALCASVLFGLASLRWNLAPYRGWCVALLGFLLSFHYVFTYDTLTSVEQSDIGKAGGHVFSFVIILAANSLVLLLCVRLLYPDLVSVRSCAAGVWAGTLAFWHMAGTWAVSAARHIWGKVAAASAK